MLKATRLDECRSAEMDQIPGSLCYNLIENSAPVAQWTEQQPSKLLVAGSNPVRVKGLNIVSGRSFAAYVADHPPRCKRAILIICLWQPGDKRKSAPGFSIYTESAQARDGGKI